ncbi:MAG: hypothetical protein K2N87_07750 [Eubacterium sp.]|nr:hypothetical protein [Eubacterium sp.]
MSTLEKAIGLLQRMPQHKLETVYTYMCFVDSQTDDADSASPEKNDTDSIARKQRGFQGLLSFAGTLPEDFDYKKELEEAREEKYAHFI